MKRLAWLALLLTSVGCGGMNEYYLVEQPAGPEWVLHEQPGANCGCGPARPTAAPALARPTAVPSVQPIPAASNVVPASATSQTREPDLLK